MSTKLFTVVQMPGETDLHHNPIKEAEYFTSFDKAFDCLVENTGTDMKLPKREAPISIEVKGALHELWIVNRPESQWHAE